MFLCIIGKMRNFISPTVCAKLLLYWPIAFQIWQIGPAMFPDLVNYAKYNVLNTVSFNKVYKCTCFIYDRCPLPEHTNEK